MLCIGTTGSLLQINAKTLDVYKYFDLQGNSDFDLHGNSDFDLQGNY
jgi:hypothetical protein